MFRVHNCLSAMMCRDLEWDVLQSTEVAYLLIRIWAPAMPKVLRNGRFHGTHETCRLLVVIFNCLVLWSSVTKPVRSSLSSRRPVIRCEPRTLNKTRQQDLLTLVLKMGNVQSKLYSGRN